MKRFIKALVLVICLTLFLSGCKKNEPVFEDADEIFLNLSEEKNENLWQLSYEIFNGSKEREIELTGEYGLVFSIEIITDSGELTLTILDGDGERLYQGSRKGSGGSPSSIDVGAKIPGIYIIKVDGNNHSGSIDIKWD